MAVLAVAVPYLIQAGIAVGTAVASSYLQPKPKQQRVDRGRLDDLRIQTCEEGAFKPLAFGKRVRLTGNIVWATPTFEYVTTSPGRSGGKGGGGRVAEPPSNNYTYRKSFAILLTGNEINRILKVAEDIETIYDATAPESPPEPWPAPPPEPPDNPLRPPVTGIINPEIPYPVALNDPSAFYNYHPEADEHGVIEGVVVAGGQAPFEFYAGTETQPQSPTIVQHEGAENTTAYRGSAVAVFSEYTLKNSRLGTFVFEIEPKLQDLAEIMQYLYLLDGKITAEELDFAALAGIEVEGFIISSREELEGWITALQTWYGFDIVPVGGKITAVLQGGAVVATIPEDELRAHDEGEERPVGAVSVSHLDPLDLPGSVDVLYLDYSPAKEFHTGDQHETLEVGDSFDRETLSFPLVGDPDTADAVGKRWLREKHLHGKPLELFAGPKWRHLIPTDVIDLALNGVTRRVKLTAKEAALLGKVKFRAVPERAAVYTQIGTGLVGQGSEFPVVAFPANSLLAFADVPPLRDEDNYLGYFVGTCPRGLGEWRGAHLLKEELDDVFDRITGFDTPATMGVALNVLPEVADPSVFDRVNYLDVGLFHGTLESVAEQDLLMQPINSVAYGNELLQFAVPTPLAVAEGEPYTAKYRLTTMLRARRGTEFAMREHGPNQTVLLLDTAVKFRRENLTEIDVPRQFKAVTVGQAAPDAHIYNYTFRGNSLKPLSVAHVSGLRSVSHDLLIQWVGRTRLAGALRDHAGVPLAEEIEIYQVEIWSGETVLRRLRIRGPALIPAIWEVLFISPAPQGAVISGNGTILFDDLVGPDSPPPTQAVAVSRQELEGDLFVEFSLDATTADHLPRVGFAPLSVQLATSEFKTQIVGHVKHFITSRNSGETRYVRAEDLVGTERVIAHNDRIGMRVRAGVVDYFINYTNELSVPFYTSQKPWLFPERYRLFADKIPAAGVVQQAKHVRLQMRRAAWYTAGMQVNDFGAIQAAIKVRVYQESAWTGRGQYTEAIL